MEETIMDCQRPRTNRYILMCRLLMLITTFIFISYSTTLAQCSGNVYDSGGSAGNYGLNESSTYVYSAPQGSIMELTFNSFDVELNKDFLFVYNGTNTSAPLMYTLSGSMSDIPSVITSTGSDITLQLVSDGAGANSGWDITLSCYSNTNCSTVPNQGLIAYYNFKETSGNVVHDVSGYGTPLNMIIEEPSNVTWNSGCGLTINSEANIKSVTSATKILNALKTSNQFTIEAWVSPATNSQSGPSRIVTISDGAYERNVTLSQSNSSYSARLRTTGSGVSNNGTPDISTSGGLNANMIQHVVYTWDMATEIHEIYVDGILKYSGKRSGNLSNWDNYYYLSFVNEINASRKWLGEIYSVAIYDRLLTSTEIDDNFFAGSCCNGNDLFTAEFDCDDGAEVDIFYTGLKNSVPKTLEFNNITGVDSVLVEIIYKTNKPATTIYVQDDNNISYPGTSIPVGTGAHIYTFYLPPTSYVTYSNDVYENYAQSLTAYAFRSGQPGKMYNSQFTTIGGYANVQDFSIPLPQRSDIQDINVLLPVSELTYDNRVLNFTATAGTASKYVSRKWGTDGVDFPNGCCIDSVFITLEDVPADANFLNVSIDSPSGSGQSYVIAGLVYAEIECYDEEICDDNIDNDNDGLIDCEDRDCGFIQNREFDNELTNWDLWTQSAYGASAEQDQSWQLSGGNSAFIDVTLVESTPVDWKIQFFQNGLTIEDTKVYQVLFDAKATANRTMLVSVQLESSPWTSYLWETVNLTPNSNSFSFEFTATETQLNNVKLYFGLGASNEDVWVDNVQFKEICATCFADAGPDQSQCQNAIFEVDASTSFIGSTGTWSVISGSATTNQSWNDANNIFTIPPGTTILRWTVAAAGICSEFDEITLTNTSNCSVDCIDPLNVNGDLEDPGTINTYGLGFAGSDAALIEGANNPFGWGERYGNNSPNTTTFNGAYYIDTSPNNSGDAHSGDYVIYLKGNQFCLSPLATNAGLACGKTYSFSVWIAAYTYSGTQQNAPFALEYSASNDSGTPAPFFTNVVLSAPASTSWDNLNWNRYVFEITLPEDGYEWSDFYFTSFSDDHGIVVDDLCISQTNAGTEALAGPDMSGCTNIFDLQANTPQVGHTGAWSVLNGDISLSSFGTPNATATMNSGNVATLEWTISDGSCSSSDRIVLSYESKPALVPDDGEVCPGESVDISFSGCTGETLWETGENTATITVAPATSRSYSVTCTDEQSTNQILNGDFESSTNFENWENWAGSGVTTDPVHVRSGSKAAVIDASSDWAGMGQSISIIPGEHYTLSFYAKTTNPNQVPSFGMSFMNSSWVQVSDKNEVEINSVNYQLYTVSGVAPLNSEYLQVGGGLSSHSQMYLDDIILTKGSNCERSVDVDVTVLSLPSPSASNDGPLTCNNSSVTLTALPAGMTYAWSGGGSGQTKSVSATGTYYVTVTDGNGCEAAASTVVTQDLSTPNASASADGFISCAELDVVLTALPAGLTYAWSGGGSGQTKTVSTGGSHTVTVTGTNGCTAVATVNVHADNIAPSVTLLDEVACEGDTIILTPELCENYGDINGTRPLPLTGWNNTFGDSRSPLIGDGELCVTLNDFNLASAQMIGLNDNPTASNSYTDIDYAMYFYIRTSQNRILLQIRENGTYITNAVDAPANIQGATFCIRRTGSLIEYLMDGSVVYTSLTASSGDLYYDHTFYSGGGLWATGSVEFTDISLCGDVQMDYLWEDNSTLKSRTLTETGNHTITVTDANGCSTTVSANATVNASPIASIDNDGPGTCLDPIVSLTAEPAGMTYLWDDGSTNQIRNVNAAGTYYVTVTNTDLCSSLDSTVVAFSDNPIVVITGNSDLCLGETTTLSPTTGGSWTSSNTDVAIVSSNGNVASIGPGTVTFTFTDSNTGCVSDPSAEVIVNPGLSISIDYNDALCLEDGSQLTALPVGGSSPYSFSWSGPNGLNTTGETINIVDAGNYYLTVTDAAGCTAETAGYVYEQFDPFIFTLSTTVCEGEDVTLTVNSATANIYAWDANADNATTPTVTVTPSPPSSTYYVTVTNDVGCTTIASAIIDVDAKTNVSITGGSDICVGETTQLSPTTGGIWTSSNTAVAGVSNSGLVTGLSSGSVTFTFTETSTNCASDPTTPITVNPRAVVNITGPSTICQGETTTLSPNTGGVWQSSDEYVATVTNDGTVTAVGEGTATFIYTNSTTGCASDASSEITINPTPSIEITGPTALCIGEQSFLTPTSGGNWESSNPEVANITNSGIVTGISDGSATFTFTTLFGCTEGASSPITVSDNINVTIDGDPIFCEGESQVLTSSVSGGVWSSSNSSIVSIDPNTGNATAVAAGNVIITYDKSGSGCFSIAEMPLEVKTKPTGFISGSVDICTGEVTNLTASTTGMWTSSDPNIAIVSNDGVVVGMGGGTVTFTFTADNGCSSEETGVLTVNPDINVTIDFGGMACYSDGMQLTANVTGGTPNFQYNWTGPGGFASNLQIIDVPINGNYNLTVTDGAGCSTSTSAFVYAAYEPFIFGLNTEVCEGESVTLSVNSNSVDEYLWSANASNSTEQSVTVVPSSPSSTYYVTVTNNVGCSTVASAEISVNAIPNVEITGNTTICEGATTTLSPTTGGNWISSDYSVASVTNGGVVTGLNSGTATFTFRDATTDCLSDPTAAVTVGNNTIVTINGNDQLCVGIPETLTSSVAGGTWSSSNTGIVTVNSSGELNPISQGTATISYSFSSSECYEDGSLEVTINGLPTININGPSTICEGENTYLIPTNGGSWTSSDESVAIVSNIGVVTGIAGGTALFTFTSDYGCSKTLATPITVLASPEVSFTGPPNICINENTTLSPSSGGIWMSSNSNIASVNSSGTVTGNNAGTVTLTFIEFVNGCISDDVLSLTVNDKPTISSPVNDILCIGETTSITPSTGGTWQSEDESIATITDEGIITAIGDGATSFIFTNSITSCSSDASSPIVVNGKPSINLIGPDDLCVGETSNITPTSGGDWTSSDVSIAHISNLGEITAVAPGEVRFIFTSNTTGCISDSSSLITVNDPINIEITGEDRICVGFTTTLSPTTGGTWESSDDNIATVSNTGVVTALEPGIVSFTFNSNLFCSSNPTDDIIIDPEPNIAYVGSTDICIGSTTELSPNSNGTWESSNPLVATITDAGIATGISNGSANFTFTNTSTGCSASTQTSLNVFEPPVVSIAGGDEICIGENTNMLPASGGSWVSNNTNVAMISSSGVVTAINEGTVTFTFTESGTGCQSLASAPITVLPKPVAVISGPNTICEGETTTLSPSSGGNWISSNNAVASVSDGGIVTAISQGLAKFTFISDTGCSSNETSPVVVFGKPVIVIDGPENLCLGETSQMFPTTGGVWQSTNPGVATITNSGLITSVSSGEVRFIYTETNTGCESEESDLVTINDIPTISILGDDEICVGGTTNLTPTAGGTWMSMNPSIATIENNGEVTGISQGTATFVFTELASGCDSEVSGTITVNPGPGITFTGGTELCVGEYSSILPSTGGGWMSTNPDIATITNGGIIEAKAQGTVNFIFTESGTGCISELSSPLTVNGKPTTSVVGGSLICIGSTTSLSPSSGGIWTSLNESVATVANNGTVTGVSSGIASFVFEDSTTGCSSDGNLSITVGDEIPVFITGDSEICMGFTTSLSPTSGGNWISSNPEIATVTNSGIVTGLAPGRVTFEFIDVSSGCTSGGVTDEISIQSCLSHDFNVSVVNEPITGNLNTNDNITASATYGAPILISKPSGSLPSITINSDGTYDFTAAYEGKYLYYIPVCIPPASSGCPKSIFEINVVDNIYSVSNPVSNLEFATTYMGPDESTQGYVIGINTIENDDCVFTGGCDLDATTVTITDPPSNGTTTIDANGVISYTPNAAFIGQDTLEYEVCVQGESKCSKSKQYLVVNHETALNSTVAADDFGFTLKGEDLTSNALNNDSDPEGDAISVIPIGTLLAPVSIQGGAYYIEANGDFTFIPDEGFTGSAEIIYTICDDNADSACTDATIHMLVFDYMSLNIRVYLEGAMMQNGGDYSIITGYPLMRADLRDCPFTGENYIPLVDPYTTSADVFIDATSKYNKIGPGLLSKNISIVDSLSVMSESGDNAIVDWVHVELRSKDDMTLPIATRSGLLQRDGDIVDLDGFSSLKFQGVNVDSFYVVVKHRSHLGVMSMKVDNSDLIDFTSPDFPTFDFGTSKNNGNDYTGLAQKSGIVDGYNVLWAGDFDSNGKVKFTNPADDQNIMFVDVLFSSPGFLINYDNAYGYLTGDFNMDGKTKYTNPFDDLNYLFSQLLLYPNNTSFLSNYNSMIEQIPD